MNLMQAVHVLQKMLVNLWSLVLLRSLKYAWEGNSPALKYIDILSLFIWKVRQSVGGRVSQLCTEPT